MLDCDGLLSLLDAAHRNHFVIANNLANVNTPGYRTRRVRFARELDRVLDESMRLRDGREGRTEIYLPMFRDAGGDGNDVVLEREIGQLNKNAIRMRLYLGVLHARIRRLRTAIEGR
jgi:flagellar basal-body rod protein FlgB